MVSTFTSNKVLEQPANGDYNDTWQIPVNRDWTFVDAALGETIVFNATAGSQTLSQSSSSTTIDTYSYVPMFITITGAISADVTYTIPSGVGGTWIVRNKTTDATGGPWSVYFTYAGGGASVSVSRAQAETIYCDTTPSSPNIGVYKIDSTISDGSITYNKLSSSALATVAEYRAGPIGAATFTGTCVSPSTNMTVAGTSGTIVPGMVISGTGVTTGTTIVSQSSGTTGGDGVYVISAAQTFSASITAIMPSTIVPTATAWDSAAFVTLTDAATITPDFAYGYNFQVTLNGVRTLANPTNMKVGQSGLIVVTEGSTATTASINGSIGSAFNATISGTIMTVSGSFGPIVDGAEITGSGVTAGTTIVNQISGSTGADGTYTVSISQTVSTLTAMTIPNAVLVAISVTGTIYSGMSLTGTGVTAGTTIGSQISGTTGGVGAYYINTSQRVATTSMSGSVGPFFGSYGGYWKFPGGTKPSFTKTAGAVNILSYCVYSSTAILVSGLTGVSS